MKHLLLLVSLFFFSGNLFSAGARSGGETGALYPDPASVSVSDLKDAMKDINFNFAVVQHNSGAAAEEESGIRMFTYKSGGFSLQKDNKESFNYALKSLEKKGFTVIGAKISSFKYVISFLAAGKTGIKTYKENYSFISDAKKAMDLAVNNLEKSGAVILEKNRKSYKIRVSYFFPVRTGNE